MYFLVSDIQLTHVSAMFSRVKVLTPTMVVKVLHSQWCDSVWQTLFSSIRLRQFASQHTDDERTRRLQLRP